MIHEDSEYDKKTRAEWLLATRTVYLFWPITYWILVSLLFNFFQYCAEPLLSEWMLIALGATFAVFSSAFGYAILEYFAYEKRGTAWLSWTIFSCSVGQLSLIYKVVVFTSFFTIATSLVTFCLFVWWCKKSLQLRAANISLKALKNNDYVQSLAVLQEVSDPQELDDCFVTLLKEWPQYEPTTSKTYKEKKLALELIVIKYT